MAKKQPKTRRRIHRAFLEWLRKNRHRFLVPVEIRHRTDKALEIAFAGYHPYLAAYLSGWCIDIPVTWEGQCWDLLASFEAAPRPVTGGYHCILCSPDDRLLFSDWESLWAAEVFEPFLEWVNGTLAQSSWIALYDFGGMTVAKLCKTQPETCAGLIAMLPCRLNNYPHKT
ncbi:MAG TPA: hypothetical protein VEP71_02880 [Gallionella sp.]|nr:hypothetical protein [Gallionella sp.]